MAQRVLLPLRLPPAASASRFEEPRLCVMPDTTVATSAAGEPLREVICDGNKTTGGRLSLSAATSIKPGQRVTSDHSSRRISSERSPANAPNAKQIASARSRVQELRQFRGVKICNRRFASSFRHLHGRASQFLRKPSPVLSDAKKLFRPNEIIEAAREQVQTVRKTFRTSSGVREIKSQWNAWSETNLADMRRSAR